MFVGSISKSVSSPLAMNKIRTYYMYTTALTFLLHKVEELIQELLPAGFCRHIVQLQNEMTIVTGCELYKCYKPTRHMHAHTPGEIAPRTSNVERLVATPWSSHLPSLPGLCWNRCFPQNASQQMAISI